MASAAQPSPPFVPIKTSWSAGEALRVTVTVLQSAGEALFVNGTENLRHALGAARPLPAERLDGKVCIVTGANAGIGLSTSEALARMGAHVILACRNKARGEEARERVAAAAAAANGNSSSKGPGSSKVEVMDLDLASLDSVRSFVKAFSARKLPLHLLVCNAAPSAPPSLRTSPPTALSTALPTALSTALSPALSTALSTALPNPSPTHPHPGSPTTQYAGIMSPPKRLTSADGLELQFQVNFLSQWLLAHELLEAQRSRRKGKGVEAPPSPPGLGLADQGTRVVMLSSCTHTSGPVNWGDMQSLRSYSPFTSYALSKMAALMAARELQKRLDRNPGYGADSAVAVHPGVVNTGLANHFFDTQAAIGTVLHASLAPAAEVAGRYIVPPASIGKPDAMVEDEGRCLQLWDLASSLTSTKDITLK